MHAELHATRLLRFLLRAEGNQSLEHRRCAPLRLSILAWHNAVLQETSHVLREGLEMGARRSRGADDEDAAGPHETVQRNNGCPVDAWGRGRVADQ